MSNVISVSQFNKYVHDIFVAEEILQNIEIYGEVSQLKFSNGSIYFSIKDADALLQCVKFGITELDYIPKEGEMVLVRGAPNYYIKGGRFSFNVSKISPYGQGILYQQFIELKNKLEKLGYFDAEIKKPIPKIIQRVGVVTSKTGAVIHDIIDVTRRRNRMIDIVLCPAKVQGIGAEETIVSAIKMLEETNVDVIIVARGGGSLEDLSPFNTEQVANAIHLAQKPIISAVGHETDFTIADFVADVRAPTPSAAAELISADSVGLMTDIQNLSNRIMYLVNDYLAGKYNDLDTNTNLMQKLVQVSVSDGAQNIQTVASKFYRLFSVKFNDICVEFDKLASKLEANNPINILKRGYSQTLKNGKAITTASETNVGDLIEVKLYNGKLTCEVKDKEEEL